MPLCALGGGIAKESPLPMCVRILVLQARVFSQPDFEVLFDHRIFPPFFRRKCRNSTFLPSDIFGACHQAEIAERFDDFMCTLKYVVQSVPDSGIGCQLHVQIFSPDSFDKHPFWNAPCTI